MFHKYTVKNVRTQIQHTFASYKHMKYHVMRVKSEIQNLRVEYQESPYHEIVKMTVHFGPRWGVFID